MRNQELIALCCRQCGGSLGEESLTCGFCGITFVKTAALEKPAASSVVEKDGKKVVGDIFFHRWAGLEDSALTVIANQIAEKTPGILAAKPSGQKAYTNFTLPLHPKPGRQSDYLVDVYLKTDGGFDVSLSASFGAETHQRLQSEGRVLKLPDQA